jgi:polysaccharide deacetylase family protein (PEP-CTERM system associated)
VTALDSPDGVDHVLTVDLEEYFQVGVFADVVTPAEWASLPSRLQPSVGRLLDLLDEAGAVATFFADDWIAGHHRAVVQGLARRGHELGVKTSLRAGDSPREPAVYRTHLRDARGRMEDIIGRPVFGHRGGHGTLSRREESGLDILVEEGFLYDSSTVDSWMAHLLGDRKPIPHVVTRPAGDLLALPVARASVLGVPIGSAGRMLRQLPYPVARKCIARHETDGQSAVLRIRSWEIDPYQPRLSRALGVRLRHYAGLERMLPRLARLLSEFRFTSAERRFGLSRDDDGKDGEWDERRGAAGG